MTASCTIGIGPILTICTSNMFLPFGIRVATEPHFEGQIPQKHFRSKH